MLETCQLLGVKKINTSGYHTQSDGLVEKFNSTLISMIAKSCDVHDRDWDVRLPYLLIEYRHRNLPENLLLSCCYGRDARILTETVLSHVRTP